ncbi:MAG TPA: four-carbon acid sugar kinase family protein [Lacunisphaera sp.]|nr:four-carbon acid sugar kinase family protein [Lacunisphaera sp.]
MIAVVADDLSGAAELAGAALRHGLTAEVQLVFAPDTAAEVVCVTTESRSLPAADAARRVAEVTRAVMATHPAWIFKKCDSMLRGPVLAEARAAAEAAGKSRIVLLAANPSRQRIVRDGICFVGGVPLAETRLARDPEHPRRSSRVADLLGGDLAGVATPDAVTTSDPFGQAADIDEATLPVGGVDFFAALLAVRCARRPERAAMVDPAGPVLAVCGSAAAWAQRQDQAAARGIPIFALPPDTRAIDRTLRETGRALAGIGSDAAAGGQSPAQLLGRLAQALGEVISRGAARRILLEGGATAAALVSTGGWTRLAVLAAPAPGVTVLRPAGADGPLLFVKPGSYDWPAALWPG